MRSLFKIIRCRRGATAVEYGLIVSLIVITMIASFKLVASQTISMWTNVSTAVSNAR